MNHFAAVCRTKSDNGKVEKKAGKPRKLGYGVKETTTTEYDDDSTSSDDEFIVEHLKDVKKIQEQDNYRKTVILRINDVDMRAEPDSGAGISLMDEHQFKALVHRSNKKITLEASQTRLNTLQGDLSVKGEFHTILRNETCGTTAKIIVAHGRIRSAPLISKKTLKKLGMIQIQPDGSLGEKNDLRIPTENIKIIGKDKNVKNDVKKITNRYQKVFEGIGKN